VCTSAEATAADIEGDLQRMRTGITTDPPSAEMLDRWSYLIMFSTYHSLPVVIAAYAPIRPRRGSDRGRRSAPLRRAGRTEGLQCVGSQGAREFFGQHGNSRVLITDDSADGAWLGTGLPPGRGRRE
jgi:hypothetical protein